MPKTATLAVRVSSVLKRFRNGAGESLGFVEYSSATMHKSSEPTLSKLSKKKPATRHALINFPLSYNNLHLHMRGMPSIIPIHLTSLFLRKHNRAFCVLMSENESLRWADAVPERESHVFDARTRWEGNSGSLSGHFLIRCRYFICAEEKETNSNRNWLYAKLFKL